MNQGIENLSKAELRKVFKRLKKDTRNFSNLIVRDPLDFLDFEVNSDASLNSIVYEVNSGSYHLQRPYLHLSAKSKGINRPTVVFDVKDALIYRFCIEQIEAILLEKTRQRNVRGGIRISPSKDESGDDYYEKWFEDWMEYQQDLRESLSHREYLVTTDIASYFENVNVLVLKDLIRSDVQGKSGVLNLLFYFLENTRFRPHYEVNTFNGLPQEDIDCSRILAYYFLKSNDEEMGEFCRESDADFYRYVDDMSVIVDEKVIGKKALKRMTESLRELNLVASIEKTSILTKAEAWSELFFQENDALSAIQEALLSSLRENRSIEEEEQKIERCYLSFMKAGKNQRKNWIKILRRFYTLCTYAKSALLLREIRDHIVEYPVLFSGSRVGKYLIRNQDGSDFRNAVIYLIDYLYSEENLYPDIESNLLETFLLLRPASLDAEIKDRLKQVCNDVFFRTSGYNALSDYARAIACLMFYRFDNGNIRKVANHYLKSSENDYLLKKYAIFASLTVKNNNLRRRVLNKAKAEQSPSINRLVNLIENIDSYKDTRPVGDFLDRDEIYIYSSTEDNLKIVEKYDPIRAEILRDLIDIYSDVG